jgi:hypothetical protein
VEILPEEDLLELAERHARIDLPIFGGSAVRLELGLPVLPAEWRDRAGDRLPAYHRKAGFSEAGDAADHDHQEDEPGDEQQPIG